MDQYQRDAMSGSGPLMDEMNVGAIKFGPKLLGYVELALLCAPIKPIGPICKQLSKIIESSSLIPGSAWRLIRQARVADALSQVRQNFFLDVDQERGDAKSRLHCRFCGPGGILA